jgi:hypothetical protein
VLYIAVVNDRINYLPHYTSPREALEAETGTWDPDRLALAGKRYDQLRGELPPQLGRIGIITVDETERPDLPGPLEMYGRQGIDPRRFGALLLVNYEGARPSNRARELVDAIERRGVQARVPTAVSLVGYNDGPRQMDQIRTDAWDIAMVHALRKEIDHTVVTISNDFDTSDGSPGYLDQMGSNEFVDQPGHIWGGECKFDRPGDPDSPMNRLIDYLNEGRKLFLRFQNSAVMYGANMAFTLQTYAMAGSWQHSANPNAYGAGGNVKLLLNLWERYTGQPATKDDATAARAELFHWLPGNHAQVSPRREVFAFAHNLGKPMSMVPALNTRLDNPIRGLGGEELGRLGDSISVDDPRYALHLDKLDELWLDLLAEYEAEVKAILRQTRQDLRLPPPGFDAEVPV